MQAWSVSDEHLEGFENAIASVHGGDGGGGDALEAPTQVTRDMFVQWARGVLAFAYTEGRSTEFERLEIDNLRAASTRRVSKSTRCLR